MYKNILSNHIKFNDDFSVLAPLFNTAGGNNIEHDLVEDSQSHPEAVAMSNAKSLHTGNGDDTVVGTANAVASSDAIAGAETASISKHTFLGSAISQSDAVTEALAIGIDNTGKISMGKGCDKIIGVANASATAISEASSQAKLVLNDISDGEANAQSGATANMLVQGVGISNEGTIHTGKGRDKILGIANVSAIAASSAFSLGKSVFENNSAATANSESVSVVEALAIGIDNSNKIHTGNDHDVIIGVANTATMTESDAKAFTDSVATLSAELDLDAVDVATAIAQSTSEAIADSFTTTLGIVNSGAIFTGNGNDVVFGLANNESVTNSEAISKAIATADNVAEAVAIANSLAIANGSAVGIANSGKINTGNGDDTIIGVAVNNSVADAVADAVAEAMADVSDSIVDSNSIADVSEAIAIGIDNADGLIETGHGNDRVVGYGKVGIIGGKITTGKGHDRVIGYGTTVGVEGGDIRLGDGNDYFKADVADFDPFTGKVAQSDDRSGSIKDAEVFGGHGNDIFKLGGFEGSVLIDGGKHHDVLKLWGSVDDYSFTLGSSGDRLTIEDSDSELVVKNVEEIYFGNSHHAYSFADLA